MAVEPEDEALSWAGDEDAAAPSPRQRRGRAEAAPATPAPSDPLSGVAAPAEGAERAAVSAPGERETPAEAERDREAPQLGSVVLLSVGVIAGIYLLYTIGWFIAVGRVVTVSGMNPVEAFMAQLGAVFAVAAPALWAAAVLWIGRGKRIGWKLSALVIGVVVLVPWPFVVSA